MVSPVEILHPPPPSDCNISLDQNYRAASFFTTSNYIGKTQLGASKELVGGEEVAIKDGEAEDVLLQVLHQELHACIPVWVTTWRAKY